MIVNRLAATAAVLTILTAAALPVLAAHPAPAPAPGTGCLEAQRSFNETARKIQAAIAAQAATDRIPGVTYSVFSETCYLAIGGVGTVSPEHSIFRMASISKLFATLAATQLIESGVLNPEAGLMTLNQVPFVSFLRRTETPERLRQWSKIKIRHLMSHQAGISKDVPGALVFFNTEGLLDHSYPTVADFYRGLSSVEFLFEPGQVPGMKYCNLCINMLGDIVAAMNPRRLPFDEYVRQGVLRPLGMNSTFYDVPATHWGRMVAGLGALQPTGQRTPVPRAFFTGSYQGSIGVATTATDLSRLGMEFLKMSRGLPGLLRSPAVFADYVTLRSQASPTIGWANGPLWQILPGETLNDPVWLGHTGTGPSERTILVVSPEKNLGVVVLFNVVDAVREKYVKIVSDLLPQRVTPSPFTQALVRNAKGFLARTPAVQNVTPPPFPNRELLKKYVGEYYADIVGTQKITLTDDGYLLFIGQKLEVEDAVRGLFRFPVIYGPAGTTFNREPVRFEFDARGTPVKVRVANVKYFTRVR